MRGHIPTLRLSSSEASELADLPVVPQSPSETHGFYKALTHVLSTQNERESRDWPQALRREPGTAGSVKRAVTCVAWALVQLLLSVTLALRCRASQVWEVPGSSTLT